MEPIIFAVACDAAPMLKKFYDHWSRSIVTKIVPGFGVIREPARITKMLLALEYKPVRAC